MTIGRNGNRSQLRRQKLGKARKLSQSRQALLESLELRQLMTVGPQLVAIQSNEGTVVSEGQILNTSPRELVFRFSDSSNIDPATLSGIQITRSGGDSAFDRAYVSTDLGTNGTVVMDFAAAVAGQPGNGTRVTFTSVAQATSGVPVLTVGAKSVNIQLNTLAGFKTTAQNILTAFQNSPAARSVVIASILRGVPTTVVADTAPVGQTLTLTGANTPKATTNLNAGAAVQVDFTASQPGASGLNTRVVITSRNFGGPGLPNVSVIGQTINVQVNSNVNNATTLGEFVDAINSNTAAAQLLTARIASGLSSTRIGTSVVNNTTIPLGGLNDVNVVPGYIGLGDTPNEVIVRFAETLPDDIYRVDILGTGITALKGINGKAYNNGTDTSRTFELDLGALVASVVPQPVVTTNGVRSQLLNEIHVYFNNDDLNLQDARNPAFYQLRYLRGTVDSNDDLVVYPQTATYDAGTDRVVLRFARNLDGFASSAGLTVEAMRLRVGSRVDANKFAALPVNSLVAVPLSTPSTITFGLNEEPGDQFSTAKNLNTSGWTISTSAPSSAVLNALISNPTPYSLDFPGADSEPGNRKIRYQQHVTGVDADGIEVIEYNFQGFLGTANGSNQLNAITDGQKEIVRNIFDLYQNYLGVRFVETTSRGATIAVGDMRAIDPTAVNGVGGQTLINGTLLANGQPAVIFDIQDSDSSTNNIFGTELFRTFARGIGNLLGLGTADEVPGLTVQSNIPPVNPGIDTELVYPGNADIVYGQYMHRPESKDIDLYRFNIPARGEVRIEVSAERLVARDPVTGQLRGDASLLDASLRLYRRTVDGSWTEVAANDNYFSEDSQIRLNLEPGDYIVGVSAKGNQTYDPNIPDSGLGGRSEGKYRLRLDFNPPQSASLRDATGVALDGDADGKPGGFFDFWFVPNNSTNTIYVSKNAPVAGVNPQPVTGNGSLASPFNTIAQALAATSTTRNVVRLLGNGGTDGDFATAGDNFAYEIGFNRLGQVQADGPTFDVPSNVTVMIDAGAIVKLSRARIGVGSSTVSVDRSGGALQVLGIPRFIDSSGRVVADLAGNPVPGNVYFTSLNDSSVGIGSNRDTNRPAAAPADWGGIDIRNQIDAALASVVGSTRANKEANGLFLNSIIHADLRFGGGNVVFDGVSQVITPIHMVDARPLVAYSLISRSADAAIAATPNSFLESNFQDPVSQARASAQFISDLERVGPDIRGNSLINNSVNGLFIKTRTTPTSTAEKITIPGRFNDTDIVHVVSENLVIQGATGGYVSTSESPSAIAVVATPSSVSGLTNGLSALTGPTNGYRYKFTFYTPASNFESPASASTRLIQVQTPTGVDSGQILLTGLPVLLPTQVLRIYRSSVVNGVESVSYLVGSTSPTQTTFTDNFAAPEVIAATPSIISTALTTPPTGILIGTTNDPFLTTGLVSGRYRYQIAYMEIDGSEGLPATLAQDAVVVTTVVGGATGRVTLDNLPLDTSFGAATRILKIYRASVDPISLAVTGGFQLVGAIPSGVRTFVDSNVKVALAPPAVPLSTLAPPTIPVGGLAPVLSFNSTSGLQSGNSYQYSYSVANAAGAESARSSDTVVTLTAGVNTIQIRSLPTIAANETLRIYRSRVSNPATPPVVTLDPPILVGVVSSGVTSFTDTDARIIPAFIPSVGTTIPTPALSVVFAPQVAIGASGAPAIVNGLTQGTYQYRISIVETVVNPITGISEFLESVSSGVLPSPLTTVNVTNTGSVANGTVTISNLPSIGATQRYRIYRALVTSGAPVASTQFLLVAELPATTTSFIDARATAGIILPTVSDTSLNDLSGALTARTNGSLKIDPGTVLKLQGSRIEVNGGGQLLAEGTDGAPIVMTSINDTRYGAGGTFDTANRRGTVAPVAGNFGGVFIGQASTGSLDFVRLSFGGGTTRIDGGFASFNAIEGHQAELRITNSRIEDNASGIEALTPTNRAGRGTNFDATIFVRGSQPIIVDNRISNNASAAINIDVDSLNSQYVVDKGRQSGVIQSTRSKDTTRIDNQGPMVAGNELANNGVNGMIVRGQTITTESVWDDADIVHVVRDEIISSNLYTYGGLRLKSNSSSSLVVKFGGSDSTVAKGLTATGRNLDIADRIGGSVQIVGVPNFPVILTTIDDDSVGAGFTPTGIPVTDTDNNGAFQSTTTLPTIGEVNRGITIDNDVATNVVGHFEYTPTAGGGALNSGITAQGAIQLLTNANVIFAFRNYVDLGANGGAVSLANTTITLQPTLIAPDVVISEGTFVGNGGALVTWRARSSFENGVAQLVNTVTFTSTASLGSMRFVNYLDEDILSPSDDLLFTTGTPGEADFRAFTIDGGERVGFSHGGVYLPGDGLINATYAGWAADRFPSLDFAITGAGTTFSVTGNINQANLPQFNDATIGTAFGPADVTTAFAWDVDPAATTSTITTFLELLPREVQNNVAPGGWRGLLFETGANDRNVAVVTERESAQTSAEARNEQTSPGNNDSPSTGQLLGTLASSAKAGDENARLGFQIQGVINRPSDRDVYSFYADSGTEVWFDIDRTSNSLDTVVELIDANGNILVSSDNSNAEEAAGTVAFAANDPVTGRQIVANPLRKSAIQTFPTDSRGQAKDLYSTNPKDAGFRVILPGNSKNTLYQVRVRSSDSSITGVADARNSTNGKSKGAYQLQIRLTEAQEFPGASVSYADIRYATTGIDLAGVPRHSPLLGEAAEQVDTATTPSNNSFATAQELGNLLQTDRATISVAGSLSSPTDVDWYTFTLDYQVLQTDLQRYFSTVFDVDYADGIGRPDTSVYLFNSAGNLLSQGLNSNILDDRAGALKGADNSDLSRGSAGTLDPFLGPFELGAAGSTISSGRYFIAVTNQGRIPTQVAAFNDPTNGNPLLRLQPSNNTQWIVEDRVGSVGGSTAQPPVTPNFMPAASAAVPFSLSDVALYLSTDNGVNGTSIFIANPMTGTTDFVGTNGQDVNDIAFRYNGDLRGFNRVLTVPAGVDADGAVNYFHLNDATGVATSAGTLNLQTSLLDNQRALTAADVGFNIEGIAFGNFGLPNPAFGGPEVGLVVGNRPVTNALSDGVQSSRLPVQARGTNVVYRFNPDTGAAIGTGNFNGTINNIGFILGNGTEVDELGYIDTTTPSGLPSRRLTFIDATTFNSTAIPPITTPVLNDGDNFVIQLPTGQTRIFEFDTGPEFRLTLDPVNGPFLADGSTFTLSNGQSFEIQSNSTPVQAGARPILYNTSMNNAQFAIALQAAMDLSGPQYTVQSNLGFGVGQDGARFNIAGAGVLQGTTGSFADPAVVNITNPGSATLNNPNAVQITFLAQDTGAILAQKAETAINAQGFLGVSTTIVGDSLVLTGATIASTQGAIFQDQVAAGGTITGIAVQNVPGSPVFAISNNGGLYQVNTTLTANSGNIGTFIGQIAAPAGTFFTGLTAGPRTLQGGQYANLLFATTRSGSVFAFNTSGVLQPVFALGASSINTGRTGLNGLAFSTLDYNLFNVSSQRGTDAGHGNPGSPDGIVTATPGGQSWHFAYEGGNQNPNAQYDAVTNPSAQTRFDAGPTTNTYNFPGGATGVLQSQPISLANIAAGDSPYFYFTYFSTTESANNTDNDLIRIKAIGDDGIWRELGNNDVDLNSPVIFNNTATQTGWKQARVNIAQFAGNQNVRFRFEFSTGGGISSDPSAELRVVPGNQLSDGQTFTVAGTVFEIDKGSSLIVPSGSSIANGSTITVSGTTYTFRQGALPLSPSATDIYYNTSQSAADITGLIATAILASGPTVSGNRIQLATGTFTLPTGSPFVAQGNAGTTIGNLPVRISETMSASEVAIAVRDALRASIGNGSTYDIFPTREEFVSLPGVRGGVIAGPFTVNIPDPNLRQFATVANPSPTNRLVNNAFEGIYLDDFVIGVAERGETIGGSSTDTTFVANPNAIANSINVGAYQLEIRGGQEYGVPTQIGLQYPSTVNSSLTGINTRLSLGATITLPNATAIVNGDSFTISDGNTSVLFFFSDTASPAPQPAILPPGIAFALAVPYSVSIANPRTGVIGAETSSTLAGRLRDILNSSVVQSRLKVTAISLTGASTGPSGPEIALSSNAVVTVPARPAGSTLAPVISVTRYTGKGDSNTPRDQGQIIIENSKISDSAQYGILLRPDARDPISGGNNPSPGAVRNTVVLNTERLAPGAVIMNNEIIGNRVGGIQIVGDNAANTTVPSSIPFARIINNTIVGGSIIKTEVLGPQVFNDLLFPNGSISFADSVISYLPNFSNGLAPATGVAIATDALGIPNYTGGFAEPATGQGAVSLGSGGRLTVELTDNLLTGSNDARPDLAIIEVGDSERAFVEVSSDGVTYTQVGSISGTVRTIDLDFYGFNRDSRLRFVRITDDVLDGATTGETVGADIDAIGALSSVPATVYAAGGIGIDVGANTSPTLLNNIIVNSVTGLNVAAASTLNPNILVSTVGPVVGGMVFQRNTANVGGIATFGQSALQPNSNIELFQDPANRIFYPNVGSPTIDSTIDSILDRPGLIAVKQPLGLDLSPIIAPTYDLNGLLRVDDPTVNTPSGVGQNVFKDRGAQDRSDNLGPSAILLLPTDNSTSSGDSNPLLGTVQVSNQTLPYFEIRLIDGVDLGSSANGSGIDAQSVSGAGIIVTRDDVELIQGVDYRFGFDATSNTIRLTPIAGVWTSDAVYKVRFVSAGQSVIPLNTIANLADGTTYVILDANGDYRTFELDLGLRLTVPTVTNGTTQSLLDGSQFVLSDGIQTLTYEFDSDGIFATNSIVIPIVATETPATVATKMINAIRSSGLNASVNSVSSDSIQVLGATVTLVSNTSRLRSTGSNGTISTSIPIVLNAGLLIDGSAVASAVADAIRAAALPGVTVSQNGQNLLLGGTQGVFGTGATVAGEIKDMAGNALRANGESGDTTLTIILADGFDYGDTPQPLYATSKVNNGPRHRIADGFYLGLGVSAEGDALPAGTDTLDDGIAFPATFVKGYSTSITVTAAGISADRLGYLNAWIDYNRDGVFADSERITSLGGRLLVNGNSNNLQVTVPGDVIPGTLNARFRYSSVATLGPQGEAPDGEVEDYVITVGNNAYQNPTNQFDVNNDTFVSPIDVLQVINYLNRNPGQISTQLPINPTTPVPPYVDVNGDSFVTPLDVLLVINELNLRSRARSAGGEGESVSADTWISSSTQVPSQQITPAASNFASPAVLSVPTPNSTSGLTSQSVSQPLVLSADSGATSGSLVASVDNLWAASSSEEVDWLDELDSTLESVGDSESSNNLTVDGLFARLEGFGS